MFGCSTIVLQMSNLTTIVASSGLSGRSGVTHMESLERIKHQIVNFHRVRRSRNDLGRIRGNWYRYGDIGSELKMSFTNRHLDGCGRLDDLVNTGFLFAV